LYIQAYSYLRFPPLTAKQIKPRTEINIASVCYSARLVWSL